MPIFIFELSRDHPATASVGDAGGQTLPTLVRTRVASP